MAVLKEGAPPMIIPGKMVPAGSSRQTWDDLFQAQCA